MNYNPFTLNGKMILVTGASSGIGRAIAIECSRMGATMFVTGRNEERLIDTLNTFEGPEHIAKSVDLSSKEGIEELVDELPKLDGIVLAAGIVDMKPFAFATPDKFRKVFNTNFFSPIELLRLVVKKKKFNSGLSVVAISSVAGREDFVPGNGIYGAGKAALSSALKYAALEFAPKQIRINTISPGMIITPMHTEGDVTEEQLSEFVKKIPMPRWGSPQEVAYAAVYLLSEASAYLTGSDIKVDGGLTI